MWPFVKGIAGSNAFLIFLDFEKKSFKERADFYILSVLDWKRYLNKYVIGRYGREAHINKDNCPIWKGAPAGISVEPNEISKHKEAWEKISR
jgi:hypothetical protein